MKNLEVKIRKYENFIREIINSIVQRIDFSKDISFLSEIKKQLKLDSENGWSFLTNSLDIIGDSPEQNRKQITNEIRLHAFAPSIFIVSIHNSTLPTNRKPEGLNNKVNAIFVATKLIQNTKPPTR